MKIVNEQNENEFKKDQNHNEAEKEQNELTNVIVVLRL